MTPIRKTGETHTQYIGRLKAYIENLESNNRALRALLNDNLSLNPRTGKTYMEEARFMFTSIALIEQELRGRGDEPALIYASGTLSQLGFDQAEQYENKCLQDGVYDGKES